MKKFCAFFSLILTTALLMPVVTAQADGELQHPLPIDKGVVKEVLKSDMVMLDNDRRYKLENILVPLYEDDAALDELNSVLLNKRVAIYSYHNDADKTGIPSVQVIADNNLWVQEDLVSKGLAWAFSTDSSQQMAAALKEVEDGARQQRLGFWKEPMYAVKNPLNVKRFMNSYQIVEGKILSIHQISGLVFLNFGKSWNTDFAVRITGNANFLGLKDPKGPKKKIVQKQGAKQQTNGEDDSNQQALSLDDDDVLFDQRQWENRTVRVRGWVHGTNEPVIDVTEKEQIDFVDGQ